MKIAILQQYNTTSNNIKLTVPDVMTTVRNLEKTGFIANDASKQLQTITIRLI